MSAFPQPICFHLLPDPGDPMPSPSGVSAGGFPKLFSRARRLCREILTNQTFAPLVKSVEELTGAGLSVSRCLFLLIFHMNIAYFENSHFVRIFIIVLRQRMQGFLAVEDGSET